MRDDLLPAQVAIDWAVSKFPAFDQRLTRWLGNNIVVSVKETPPDSPNNVIVATEKEAVPLEFMVEAGAYINVLRSSLDILASAVATRCGIADIDSVYFPVAKSADTFRTGYQGNKYFRDKLPPRERLIIEDLKPYKGGNDLLYALHRLDIVRKHRRLFEVEVAPSMMILRDDVTENFIPVSTGYMRSADDETVLGIIPKGIANPVLHLSPHLVFLEDEATLGWPVSPVLVALHQFAHLARTIVAKFDYA